MSLAIKKTIGQELECNNLDSVVSLVIGDRKLLSHLIRISYDKDTLRGWRAIMAVGLVARSLVKTDSAFLRETCRKLLWSLTDESGGIGWSAPEMLGEIVSSDPRSFQDLIPIIASAYEVEEDVFRAGVLYALGRIAEKEPEFVAQYQKIMILSLVDRDPLVRVRGIQLIKLLWFWARDSGAWGPEFCERINGSLARMVADRGEAWIYKKDDFASTQVGEEATIMINTIS